MKIQSEHFVTLASACNITLANHPEAREQYRAAGLSDTRFAWDVLRASRINGVDGIRWICDTLYEYLDDTHITTALLKIVRTS